VYRFGYGEAREINGAARSIHNERQEPGAFPKTVIVKKVVEDVKATQSDLLG
jgi:predicted Rdx family selenoprotein